MVIILLMGGGLYFYKVFSQSSRLDSWISSTIFRLFKFTCTLVVIPILGHVIVAAISSRETEVKLDERERKILNCAASFSGAILCFVVIFSLGNYLISENSSLLFYTLIVGLIVSQLAEYVM